MTRTLRLHCLALASLAALGLTACGGGGSSGDTPAAAAPAPVATPAAVTLSGTAATGAPFSGASLTVTDKRGQSQEGRFLDLAPVGLDVLFGRRGIGGRDRCRLFLLKVVADVFGDVFQADRPRAGIDAAGVAQNPVKDRSRINRRELANVRVEQ